MASEVDKVKQEWLVEFRDCMFLTEDLKTAMVLFITGAKELLDVNSIVLIIRTGQKKTCYVAELSPLSPRALLQLNQYPLRILAIRTRRWLTETKMRTPLGNPCNTIGYLAAGSNRTIGSEMEEALIWENLVAIANVVFMRFIQPEINKHPDGKNKKRKGTKVLRPSNSD
jgi:hypothetical protein